jgi:CRISPR system Cascade subunit CasE
MYLARLELNGQERAVCADLGNAHALHQRIMQAFPDEQRQNARADWNILFRQEPDSDVILVQSEIEGCWGNLPPNYLKQHSSKSFTPDAKLFDAGRVMQFRLKANPTKRNSQTKKLIGMFHQADQLTWLERKANQHGFILHGVDVIPTPNAFGIKARGQAPIRLVTVLYQGVLQVTDSDLLIAAIQEGIGRGRSYGCGLLSVARL